MTKPPKFTVQAVMLAKGYQFIDGGFPYAQQYFGRNVQRHEIKSRTAQPVLRLTQDQVNQIESWANTEDDILIGALAINDTGMLPDPIAERVKTEVEKIAGNAIRRLAEYEKRDNDARLAAEAAEDARLLAEEQAKAGKIVPTEDGLKVQTDPKIEVPSGSADDAPIAKKKK